VIEPLGPEVGPSAYHQTVESIPSSSSTGFV
jgi:hypothetical protein